MNDLIVLPEPPAAKDELTESKPDENAPTQPAPRPGAVMAMRPAF